MADSWLEWRLQPRNQWFNWIPQLVPHQLKPWVILSSQGSTNPPEHHLLLLRLEQPSSSFLDPPVD